MSVTRPRGQYKGGADTDIASHVIEYTTDLEVSPSADYYLTSDCPLPTNRIDKYLDIYFLY